MSTASIRLAVLAAAFVAPGMALAQTPAPAPAVAPAAAPAPATAAQPPAAPAAAGQGVSAYDRPNPPGMTPAPPAPATSGAPKGSGEGKGGRQRNSNFMPANPDATPVLPGQSPSTSTGGAAAGSTGGAKSSGGSGGGGKPAVHGGGMQRAFMSYQTKDELNAYRQKVKSVKTVEECKALMDSTRKELEPRAKAQNKSIDVDVAKICATGKERGRLTG